MDAECLKHCLAADEHTKFEQDGFIVVDNALPYSMVADLTKGADRIGQTVDFIGNNDLFLELIDWPTTFPKDWGLLGWNIHIYHNHYNITPPLLSEEREVKRRLSWHQDSGRLSLDAEIVPSPRFSVKVGYFLTDVSEPGRGNFSVVPGSHLKDELEFSPDPVSDPADAIEVCVPAGTAAIFDRRLWPTRGRNFSNITRKALFIAYAHRWLHPRDDRDVSHFMERSDPIRRQLLGAKTEAKGLSSPQDEDVPLRAWIKEHLGEEAVADRSIRNIT